MCVYISISIFIYRYRYTDRFFLLKVEQFEGNTKRQEKQSNHRRLHNQDAAFKRDNLFVTI